MSTPTPKRAPGRPPTPETEQRRNVVAVRFTDADLERVERLAAEAGVPVATWAWRQLVERS